MPLAEGVSARIAYKAYASGVITTNALADSATDLVASGAQALRRVSSSLKLARDAYQSNEIRADRQIVDFRLGTRRVSGSISGEFSPKTYGDFFQAAFRSSWGAVITLGQSQLTSVAADTAAAKFIFASGNPVTLGWRVGDIIRGSGMADADNNAKNFVILGFGGTNNREVTVYPPPDTMTADTSFSFSTVKSLTVPSLGFVSRKFGIEIYSEDIDVSRLFTECRVGGFTVQLPASGLGTIEVPFMGRDMETYEEGAAPFFTSPTAETTTGILAAVEGFLRVNGSVAGVVTGLNIQMNLNGSSDPVVGQDFVPEIFLGRANVTGQVTAFFENADLINSFVEEDEIDILAYLTATNAPASAACSIYLPRVKLSDADVATSGEGGQSVTFPFQALKYVGATAGVEQTTIRMADTEIA